MEDIKESMTQMSQMFSQKLSEFENRQLQLTPTSEASNLADDFNRFKDFVINSLRTLQAQVDCIAHSNDTLEMHNRRKILLLHGVPEVPKEETLLLIVKEITQRCKLPDLKPEHISRCHRMGRSSDRPRPILFKVRDFSLRGKIWAAKSNLRGSGITMSEFLTKTRHDTFMAARQLFGISNCWTRDGHIFVLASNGIRHRISSVAELKKLDVQSRSNAPAVVTVKSAPVAVAAAVPAKESTVAAKSRRNAGKRN